ncbi:hypothetical protein ACWDTP_04990 [Mycobacterium sp. NPDC003449]
MSALSDALTGRFVHFTRSGEHGFELRHQGQIIAADDRLVLIDFSVIADDGPRMQGLVSVDELYAAGAFLYETAEEMFDGYERFPSFNEEPF